MTSCKSWSATLSLFFVTRSSSLFVQNCTDPREILKLTCTVFSALYWTDPAEILSYLAALSLYFVTPPPSPTVQNSIVLQSTELICKFSEWLKVKSKMCNAMSSLFILSLWLEWNSTLSGSMPHIYKSRKHTLRIVQGIATFRWTFFFTSRIVQSPWTVCCKSLCWTLRNGTSKVKRPILQMYNVQCAITHRKWKGQLCKVLFSLLTLSHTPSTKSAANSACSRLH